MNYIADLHVHSPYSRATSSSGTLEGLAHWAGIKGINVIASGDFTHPAWFRELNNRLRPAEPGFFRLKTDLGAGCRFILSTEISCIYKRHGRVRKVHNLLYVPDMVSAARINARLERIGNIVSDGRPILGLDSRDLLEILLDCAPGGFMVPAHIWTPWFSIFGSKSGFDSIDECFDDLAGHIFALETGLSSDPAMNRTVSMLDRFALISNSDCHSPQKLGREANLFTTGFDYFSLRDALRSNDRTLFAGTVEFFPEEGKYHADGHRECGVRLTPDESRAGNGICPVCRRPLTIGVLNRVTELADRREPYFPASAPEVHSLIPLPEILSEIAGTGVASKKVTQFYAAVIARFGSEFHLLLNADRSEIDAFTPVLGEAVGRLRNGRVITSAGFDGQFGTVRLFASREEIDIYRQGGEIFS